MILRGFLIVNQTVIIESNLSYDFTVDLKNAETR